MGYQLPSLKFKSRDSKRSSSTFTKQIPPLLQSNVPAATPVQNQYNELDEILYQSQLTHYQEDKTPTILVLKNEGQNPYEANQIHALQHYQKHSRAITNKMKLVPTSCQVSRLAFNQSVLIGSKNRQKNGWRYPHSSNQLDEEELQETSIQPERVYPATSYYVAPKSQLSLEFPKYQPSSKYPTSFSSSPPTLQGISSHTTKASARPENQSTSFIDDKLCEDQKWTKTPMAQVGPFST